MTKNLNRRFADESHRINLVEFKGIIDGLDRQRDNKAFFRAYRTALLRLPVNQRLEACIYTYTRPQQHAFPSPRILLDAAKFARYSTLNDPKATLDRLIYLAPVGRFKDTLTKQLNTLQNA